MACNTLTSNKKRIIYVFNVSNCKLYTKPAYMSCNNEPLKLYSANKKATTRNFKNEKVIIGNGDVMHMHPQNQFSNLRKHGKIRLPLNYNSIENKSMILNTKVVIS